MSWVLERIAPADKDNVGQKKPATKWDIRFRDAARLVATWSSCYQPNRQIGAVVTLDKRIMTTGYNGAGSGIVSCVERGECMRRKMGIPSGTRHEICYAVHAEQNAIVQAARLGIAIKGSDLYCTHQPCVICAKMIINSGIVRVVYEEGYPDDFALQLFNEAGVTVERLVYQGGSPDGNTDSNTDGNTDTDKNKGCGSCCES